MAKNVLLGSSRYWLLLSAFEYVILLEFLLLAFSPSAVSKQLGANESDRTALLALKTMIEDDPLKVMSSWNESTHFCEWTGVTCDPRYRRVTVLHLHSLKLVGSITPQVGNLSFLRVLALENNSFIHEIPPELGRLRRLQVLRLNNNSLTGEIPANISACVNLNEADFSNNMLGGKVSAELGRLFKLQRLYLDDNHFIGSIPPSLGNLSSLVELSASSNNLTGKVPDVLCRLSNLTVFVFRDNNLTGSLPSCLFNLSFLVAIDVGKNHLQGSLPSNLGITIPNLQFFSIYDNNFSGSFPVTTANATNLVTLVVARNELIGKVPALENLSKLQRLVLSINFLGSGEIDDSNFLSSLTNATSLETLELNENNFGGTLPDSIANLSTEVVEINLSLNKFSGRIPQRISNLINLRAFYVADNHLSGEIPFELGNLKRLQELALLQNKFWGEVPTSFGNLTSLTKLSLSQNNLRGEIPSGLGNCLKLELLDLSQNNFSGPIPKEIFLLSSLTTSLDLSHNHITGSLSEEIGNLKNLEYLDLSENKLSGHIPATLGSCVRLETLNLKNNTYQGTIPSTMANLRGLQDLDLSCNKLSGEIPDFFKEFDYLQNLNLSHNDLEGRIPIEGIFKNASAFSIVGNDKLCGGIPELHLPVCKSQASRKRKSTIPYKIVISICCGFLVITALLFVLYLCWSRRSRKVPPIDSSESSISRVSYQRLFKATDGFSSANLIGVGGYGAVYKATSDNDTTNFAVKVLNLGQRGASKSFAAECEVLRNIRHRNLVKVLTSCSGVDNQGNDFKAIVYEYMVNGSLEDWLHFKTEEQKSLDFVRRLNIAIDVASALDYLHNHCQSAIIHCDLKPSNVLLDNEMTARVSDFGLARFALPAVPKNPKSSTSVRGSIGYTAPEYGVGSQVSVHGDVYSFGILLLEMFTGRRPTDEMFKDSLNLHNYAKAGLPEEVEGIADPLLLEEIVEEERSTTRKASKEGCSCRDQLLRCLVSVIGIGVACSAESPNDRMNIHEVAGQLHTLKKSFLESV